MDEEFDFYVSEEEDTKGHDTTIPESIKTEVSRLVLCPFCPLSVDNLDLHLERDHQPEVLDEDSKEGIKLKSEPGDHMCSRCGLTFKAKADLQGHLKSIHKSTEIIDEPDEGHKGKEKDPSGSAHIMCSKCGLTFKSRIDLQGHMRSVHKSNEKVKEPEEVIPVKEKPKRNEKSNIRAETLKKQLEKVKANKNKKALHEDGLYQCPDCGGTFQRKADLDQHVLKRHRQRDCSNSDGDEGVQDSSSSNQCRDCGLNFKFKIDLYAHARRAHNKAGLSNKRKPSSSGSVADDNEAKKPKKDGRGLDSSHGQRSLPAAVESQNSIPGRIWCCQDCRMTFHRKINLDAHNLKVHKSLLRVGKPEAQKESEKELPEDIVITEKKKKKKKKKDKTNKFPCSSCDQSFKWKIDLAAHEVRSHGGGKKKPQAQTQPGNGKKETVVLLSSGSDSELDETSDSSASSSTSSDELTEVKVSFACAKCRRDDFISQVDLDFHDCRLSGDQGLEGHEEDLSSQHFCAKCNLTFESGPELSAHTFKNHATGKKYELLKQLRSNRLKAIQSETTKTSEALILKEAFDIEKATEPSRDDKASKSDINSGKLGPGADIGSRTKISPTDGRKNGKNINARGSREFDEKKIDLEERSVKEEEGGEGEALELGKTFGDELDNPLMRESVRHYTEADVRAAKFICDRCGGRPFSSTKSWRAHNHVFHDPNPFCPVCGIRPQNLAKHTALMHKDVVQCQFCPIQVMDLDR